MFDVQLAEGLLSNNTLMATSSLVLRGLHRRRDGGFSTPSSKAEGASWKSRADDVTAGHVLAFLRVCVVCGAARNRGNTVYIHFIRGGGGTRPRFFFVFLLLFFQVVHPASFQSFLVRKKKKILGRRRSRCFSSSLCVCVCVPYTHNIPRDMY